EMSLTPEDVAQRYVEYALNVVRYHDSADRR
ncbi:MAG: hypothetical protein QOC83_7186, partial [Pseudonocardiales bacterium]|nr:hypothetical protein [Pseudonocardiales bacterium]